MKLKTLLFSFLGLCLALSGAFGMPTPEGVAMAITLPTLNPKTVSEAIVKYAGQHSKTLIMQTLNNLEVFQQLQVDRNVSRHGKLLPKIIVEPGMRPLDVDVEENKGKERTLTGRKLIVRDCMKLFKFVPEDVIETYLSDMLAPGAKVMPIQQQFWMAEMQKLASEINDNFYSSEYNGDAAAWDSGSTYSSGDVVKYTTDGYNNFYKANASTSAGESPISTPAKWDLVNATTCFTGPAKLIADEISGGGLTNVITTGAITSSNAYEKAEQMIDEMDTAHRNKGGVIHVSHDVFRKYLKDERATYSAVATPDMGDGEKILYGTMGRWKIVPATWMGNAQRMIANIERRNLIVGTNLDGVPGVTKSVEKLQSTQSVAKWTLGFEVADLEVLYVNDQA